jgi:prevent-host-death family protein
MKTVSMDELKKRLSELVLEAGGGKEILITRHHRPVARLAPAGTEHLHRGRRFGKARLRSLFRGKTRGKYLEVLAEDRRGPGDAD